MREVLQKLLTTLKENHKHHEEYDDHGGYPDSQLCLDNVDAIRQLTGLIADLGVMDPGVADLARQVAHEHRETHDYLPQTADAMKDWRPHTWVLTAMVRFHLQQSTKTPIGATFEEDWKRFEDAGYQYGGSALEKVQLGWKIAKGLVFP